MSAATGVPSGPASPAPGSAVASARTLVCVAGVPGAGKSTVGALVAARAGLCLVDLDSVTTALVEAFAASLGTTADLDAPRFAALRDARYDCLAEVAADNLRAGRGVVAVAPFTREAADADAWRGRGLEWGATRVVLCWLDVDPSVASARAEARGLPRDLAKAGRVRQGAAAASGGPRADAGHTASDGVDRAGLDLVLDGSAEPESSAALVVTAVARGTMPP